MNTAKHEFENLLKRLPDDCSLEDIQYHVSVLIKIKEGLAEIDRNEVFTDEEVDERLNKIFT